MLLEGDKLYYSECKSDIPSKDDKLSHSVLMLMCPSESSIFQTLRCFWTRFLFWSKCWLLVTFLQNLFQVFSSSLPSDALVCAQNLVLSKPKLDSIISV